jgi:HEAT repeat protein
MNVNAALTFERAPIVARLRTVGTHLVPCVHGGEHTILRPLAEVRHVYKGDATLVGRWIELHRCIGESARSFLAWGDGYPPTPGGEWVATFALIDLPAFPDTTLHAQQLLAEGYGGTMLTDRRPLASGAPRADRAAALTELLHDLAASLADPLTAVSAATALRQFDAGPSPMTPPDSAVWRDPVAAVELLSATRRDPPRLRWTIAWMNPARAGPEGEQRLLALAFDSDPLVRQPALHWLSRPEEAGLAADGPVALAARELAGLATARADSPFDELLTEALEQGGELFDDESLTHHLKRLKAERDPDARRRALLAMRSVQRGDAVEALLAGLDDADAAVRRAAAFVLSTSGFEHSGAVQARLHDVPDHEDETVQALAGYAELLHGSVYGLDRLKRLLESGSPAAGERAVELLARAGARPMDRGDEPLRGDGGVGIAGMLVRAAGHDDVVVRSRALIALARIAPRQFQMGASESSFEEVIASAEADSSALVRQAALLARAALRRDEEMSGEGAGALKSVPYDLGYGGR